MGNRVEFKVTGKIRGKARPRFYGTSKLDTTKVNVRAYKVNDDKIYENLIKSSYIGSGGFRFNDKSYLRMEMDMYFKIPKSYSKKRRRNCLEGIEKAGKKPDIDNILKNFCDALNGVAYKDDVQVVEVECKKYYTEEEDYVIVRLEEIKWI